MSSNKYVPHIVTEDHGSTTVPTNHQIPHINPHTHSHQHQQPHPHGRVHPTTRSRSTSQIVASNVAITSPRESESKDTTSKESRYKRPYSYSVSSVASNSSDLDLDDAYVNKNKKMMNDVDLENQLILTAGGKREDVFWFFLKLLVLMALVLGCGVLIFYAL